MASPPAPKTPQVDTADAIKIALWSICGTIDIALLFAVGFVYSARDAMLYGPVWTWLSSDISATHNDALIAIATVSIVAWSGGIVALTIRKRFTARLSVGMNYLLFASIAPIFALVLSGVALRVGALIVAVNFVVLGLAQEWARQTTLRLQRSGTLKVDWKRLDGKDNDELPEETRLNIIDALDRGALGGRHRFVIAAFCVVPIFAPDNVFIAAACAVALLIGIRLVFRVLVEDYVAGSPAASLFSDHVKSTDGKVQPKDGAATSQADEGKGAADPI